MRITLVVFRLFGGGAERVVASMANHWARKGWQITLITFDDGTEATAYHLHPAVALRPLSIASASLNPVHAVLKNIKRHLVLRSALAASSPAVIISFANLISIRVVLATLGMKVPVMVAERCHPRYNAGGVVSRTLRRWSYSRAACIVTQTADALAYFSAALRRRGRVIPNPVEAPPASGRASIARRPGEMRIVAMGRLTYQKGFERLLAAFAVVAPRYPQWKLVIYGLGELADALHSQRDALGLAERVTFPGWTGAPYDELRRAHLFVLSSRFEGFPNVLCEALACGLPVVSFDCPSGPRDIIRAGTDGVLVPPDDVPKLAAAIDRLMGAPAERKRMAARAVEVVQRFNRERVMGLWEDAVRAHAVGQDAAR